MMGALVPLELGRTLTPQAGGSRMAMLANNDDERFFLENGHQTGRDAALPDHGLAPAYTGTLQD